MLLKETRTGDKRGDMEEENQQPNRRPHMKGKTQEKRRDVTVQFTETARLRTT